jgi:hypothetical protein
LVNQGFLFRILGTIDSNPNPPPPEPFFPAPNGTFQRGIPREEMRDLLALGVEVAAADFDPEARRKPSTRRVYASTIHSRPIG